LVGHSFSGMIVTEAGVDANISALVYVAARAPDAEEDYPELAKEFPAPPASAGIVFNGESQPAALHRDAHGRNLDRSRREPLVTHLALAGNHRSDSASCGPDIEVRTA